VNSKKEPNSNEQTLRKLMSEFGPMVKRMSATYERDQSRSVDLYQEIWIAVWDSIPKFNHRCSWKTWIYRIAHNTAVRHICRESKGHRLLSLEEVVDHPDPSSNHDRFEHKEVLENVGQIISQLKPIDRQLFLLYLEGLSQEEISEITGLSLTNISTKISRLKKIIIGTVGN
jgi:RNA polymerase sigma-70 factor, ECF subfamily